MASSDVADARGLSQSSCDLERPRFIEEELGESRGVEVRDHAGGQESSAGSGSGPGQGPPLAHSRNGIIDPLIGIGGGRGPRGRVGAVALPSRTSRAMTSSAGVSGTSRTFGFPRSVTIDVFAPRRAVEPVAQVRRASSRTPTSTLIRLSVHLSNVKCPHRTRLARAQASNSVSSGSRSPRSRSRSTSTQPSPRASQSVDAWGLTLCAARIPRQPASAGSGRITSR